jgi:hypothetical protein
MANKWEYKVGVSESDFHENRSKDTRQHYASELERIASIGKNNDTHPMLLGSTYPPNIEDIIALEKELIKQRGKLDMEAVNNDDEIEKINKKLFPSYRERLFMYNRRKNEILAQRRAALDDLDGKLLEPPYKVPEDWDGDGILTKKDLYLAKWKALLMDKLGPKKESWPKKGTALLPPNHGIASYLPLPDLRHLNEANIKMHEKTKGMMGSYIHSSNKDIKKLIDRITGVGRKKKSRRRKRRKPKKRKTRQKKKKTQEKKN